MPNSYTRPKLRGYYVAAKVYAACGPIKVCIPTHVLGQLSGLQTTADKAFNHIEAFQQQVHHIDAALNRLLRDGELPASRVIWIEGESLNGYIIA